VSFHTRIQTSLCWQQARLKWLQEGDANTKFFNVVMSAKRRYNSIHLLQVNGVCVEGVQNIREAIFNHFSSHYKASNFDRPRVEDLRFRRLSVAESGSIIRPFTVEEVKQAIWDCDSYKSSGPDGISFGFIKQFWPKWKEDFMRFVLEFNYNGRLTKGENAIFIALIPKVESPQRLNDF
jgi:hypothetical protein